jgi:hypothetical protein
VCHNSSYLCDKEGRSRPRHSKIISMKFTSAATIIALLSAAAPFAAKADDDESSNMVERVLRQREPKGKKSYEVWASDQSNSVAGQSAAGVKGSYLWIWDSQAIQEQINGGTDAKPLSCTPTVTEGPCDLLDIFPQDLTDGAGTPLGNLPAFGRLHGVIRDPFNLYVNANIFAPDGGYIGIIDTNTKEAIGLFRVTETDATGVGRSVHMSFWNADGSSIIVDNLNGKMIERIDVTRDKKGKITNLEFNKSAGVYLGKDFAVENEATAFSGQNAFGNNLIGSVVGDYADAGKS